MPDYKYSEEVVLRSTLLSQQRKCDRDHVTPLLQLKGLPAGTVITKEYDAAQDQEFWEIQIGETRHRGVDIIALLINIVL